MGVLVGDFGVALADTVGCAVVTKGVIDVLPVIAKGVAVAAGWAVAIDMPVGVVKI